MGMIDKIKDSFGIYDHEGKERGRTSVRNGRVYMNDTEIPEQYISRVDNKRVYLTQDAHSLFGNRTGNRTNEGEIRVPVAEERLSAGTRQVQAGEVEVQKRVIEEQKSIPVEVHTEHAHIERRDTTDRPLTEAEASQAFKEETFRVPLRGEQVVGQKEVIAAGEVVVRKDVETTTQNVQGTVRREEVTATEHMDAQYSKMRPMFEDHYRRTNQTGDFNSAEPNYRLGYQAGMDRRYAGKRFDDVESDLRSQHGSRPDEWERLKMQVREGFERANR